MRELTNLLTTLSELVDTATTTPLAERLLRMHAAAHELACTVRATPFVEATHATRLILETATQFAREFERAEAAEAPDARIRCYCEDEDGDDPLCPVHGTE